MSGLSRVFDAAVPPQIAPPGCAGVLGYLGGGRAARAWTLAEWDRFTHLIQFPAWVPDVAHENAIPCAQRAADAMRSLGWAPFQDARRAVVCDLETLVVPGWYQQFAAEIEQQGFCAVAYGSLGTVLGNAASEVWAAAWNGSPALMAGQTIHAHQYQANTASDGTVVDYSVADEWLMARGGQGPRHT